VCTDGDRLVTPAQAVRLLAGDWLAVYGAARSSQVTSASAMRRTFPIIAPENGSALEQERRTFRGRGWLVQLK
jgi:hypothetical protein